MRKRLVELLVCLVLMVPQLVIGHKALADAPAADCGAQTDGGHCGQVVVVDQPGTKGAGGRSGAGNRSAGPPMDYISYPRMGTMPDGTPCLISQQVAFPRPAPANQRVIADAEWRDMLALYRLCPSQSPSALAIDPQVIAIRASQDILLPKPKPAIAPGWGLTGKTAYLETGGTRQHHFGADTPLGPLSFDSVGRYYVDWGDGSKTGPYSFEGEPWPDGRIVHDYINVGTYDVVVREEWTSTWSVADAGGVLDLRTEGRIEDFRVKQIQVVVTPG